MTIYSRLSLISIDSEPLAAVMYRYKHERTRPLNWLIQVISPIPALSDIGHRRSSCRAAFRFGSIQWQWRVDSARWEIAAAYTYSATYPRYKRQHSTPSSSASTRSPPKQLLNYPLNIHENDGRHNYYYILWHGEERFRRKDRCTYSYSWSCLKYWTHKIHWISSMVWWWWR